MAIFFHSFQLLFRDCDYPRGFVYWIGSHAVLFWFLFWDFFKKTYLSSSTSSNKSSVNGEVAQHRSKFPVCFGQTDTLIGLLNSRSVSSNGTSIVKNGVGSMTNGSTATNGPSTRLNNHGTASNGLGKERGSGDHDTENSSKSSRKLD